MKKILILGKIHPSAIKFLSEKKKVSWEVILEQDLSKAKNFFALLQSANAILVRTQNILKKWLEQAENLEIISRHGVGIDNLPLDFLKQKKIPICITGDTHSISVAEHSIMLLLCCLKKISVYQKNIKNWQFRDAGLSCELYQKTILLIGCGRVGEKIVERLLAFGVKIKVFDPYRKRDLMGVEFVDSLAQNIPFMDAILLCCPKNKESENILNKEKLKLMKAESVLINTARGGLVDETFLQKLLLEKKIAAAGFDVFLKEPLAPDNQLLLLDNFIASPHIAAKTRESIENVSKRAIKNIFDFWQNCLNPDFIVKI